MGLIWQCGMNAELGTAYDELSKNAELVLLDGNNSDRDGWGVMCERWNKYDVHGLVGQKRMNNMLLP